MHFSRISATKITGILPVTLSQSVEIFDIFTPGANKTVAGSLQLAFNLYAALCLRYEP